MKDTMSVSPGTSSNQRILTGYRGVTWRLTAVASWMVSTASWRYQALGGAGRMVWSDVDN